jgi:hypothetical protein
LTPNLRRGLAESIVGNTRWANNAFFEDEDDDEYENDLCLTTTHLVFAFAVRSECSIVASIFRMPETAPRAVTGFTLFNQASV